MLKMRMKPVAAAVGTAFVASLAASSFADVQDSPFAAKELDTGYDLLAQAESEGKCGEGKCGESKSEDEGKCGEGKCGESKSEGEGKCGEGKCGESKSEGEGKCGEGKCGGAA